MEGSDGAAGPPVGQPVWTTWWAAGRPGAMTSVEYMEAMEDWVTRGGNSGSEASEELAGYTVLNATRMRRVYKTYRVCEAMRALLDSGSCRGQHWVVITESWCGDAAQSSPLIRSWAERAGVRLDWVLRDGDQPIIEDFLTNGGRSIPVWVVADEAGRVMGRWGPRPSTARRMALEHRNAPDPKPPYAEFASKLQLWYARDRGREIEEEALALLTRLSSGTTQ